MTDVSFACERCERGLVEAEYLCGASLCGNCVEEENAPKCMACDIPLSEDNPDIQCFDCIAAQEEALAEQGLENAVDVLGISRVLVRLLALCEERRGYRITERDQAFAAWADGLRSISGVAK